MCEYVKLSILTYMPFKFIIQFFIVHISCHLSRYMIELYEFIDIWAYFFFVSWNMEMPMQLKYNMLHLPAIYNNVLSEPIIFLFYCYFCFSLWNSYSKRIYSMYSNSMSDKLIKAWINIVYVIGVCVKNEYNVEVSFGIVHIYSHTATI